MQKYKHPLVTLGAVVLMVLFGSLLSGSGKAWAYYSFDFTYSGDSLRACHTYEPMEFRSLLKNTGTDADTYYVTLFEYPSTPQDWWSRFCAGGICFDSLTTVGKSYLAAGDTDVILLDALARSVGQGTWKIKVQSKFSPVLSDSLNFHLTARQTPVTNEWGLIILMLLIIASGMYLMFRKFRTVRQI